MTTPGGKATGSSSAVRARYLFSDAVPEGRVLVSIVTRHGVFIALEPGAMPQETLDRLNEGTEHRSLAMPKETFDRLAEAADHLHSVGLATIRLPRQAPSPEP